MTTPKLPSAEEIVDEIEPGDCLAPVMRAYARAVLEAAAEVADGSVKPGWLIAKEIRKLTEDL